MVKTEPTAEHDTCILLVRDPCLQLLQEKKVNVEMEGAFWYFLLLVVTKWWGFRTHPRLGAPASCQQSLRRCFLHSCKRKADCSD
jgi:hypothetical protein